MAQTVPVFPCFYFSSNPPGLRCPVFAARHGGRLQKQTAAPAPLRLFLPQAAPQLRSPATHSGAPAACGGAPLLGGSEPITAPSAFHSDGELICRELCRSAVGTFEPTHPPTEVTPGLRPRPLTGALHHKLLLLFAGCTAAAKHQPKTAAKPLNEGAAIGQRAPHRGAPPQAGRGYRYGRWVGLDEK